MTTGPSLKLGSHLYRGLSAVALFVVLAVVFLNAGAAFGPAQGFPDVVTVQGEDGPTEVRVSITENIGYAMFDIDGNDLTTDSQLLIESEGFLVAFEIIDVVLVAALVAAVMLARREVGGEVVTALRTRGGDD